MHKAQSVAQRRASVMNEMTRRALLQRGLILGAATLTPSMLIAACGGREAEQATESQPAATEASQGAESELGGEIQLIVHTQNNAYFQQWIAGLELACAARGVSPVIGTSEGDVSRHIQVLDDAIGRGAKFYNGVAPDDSAVLEIARRCNASKVWMAQAHAHEPWVMVPELGEYYVHFQASNDFRQSYALGKALFEAMGGSGKVINIQGLPGHGASAQRSAGYHKAAEESSGIEIVAEDFGNFDRVATQPVVDRLLTAHPDVAAVTCASDDSAMGVIASLKERGLDNVKVVGIDAIPEFLDEMQAGAHAFGTVSIMGTWSGVWLATKVFDAAMGVELDPLERMMVSGSLVITSAEAAAAYKELEYEAPESPLNPIAMSRALEPEDWSPQNPVRVFRPEEPETWWTGRAADKPPDFEPPAEWSESFDAGNADTIDADYEKRAAANDPYAEIRSMDGVETVV